MCGTRRGPGGESSEAVQSSRFRDCGGMMSGGCAGRSTRYCWQAGEGWPCLVRSGVSDASTPAAAVPAVAVVAMQCCNPPRSPSRRAPLTAVRLPRPSAARRARRPTAPARGQARPTPTLCATSSSPSTRGSKVPVRPCPTATLTTGHSARLSLPDPSRLSSFSSTALPHDQADLAALEDRLMTSYRAVQHFEFLSPARVADLYTRHRELPDSLVPDQRALLAAVLCLGRLSELSFEITKEGGSRMRPIAPGEAREDITYFRMALGHLDAFAAASCTALCEWPRPDEAGVCSRYPSSASHFAPRISHLAHRHSLRAPRASLHTKLPCAHATRFGWPWHLHPASV